MHAPVNPPSEAQRGRRAWAPTEWQAILSWSLVCAAGSSLLQLASFGVQEYALGLGRRRTPDPMWWLPLSEWLWLAPLTAAFLGLVLARAGVDRTAVLACLVWPGWMSVLLTYPRLHRPAILILSLGLAIQTARFVTRSLSPVLDPGRAVPLFGLVVLVLYSLQGPRRPVSQAQVAEGGQRPSVLLIVLDTVRAQNLSLYGYPRPTSRNLQQIALGGVTFEDALSTSSWTLPSHASLMTGRLPHETSADWLSPLDAEHRVLAEVFRDRGYRTAAFVANAVNAGASAGFSRGFSHFSDVEFSVDGFMARSQLGARLLDQPVLRRTVGWFDTAGRRAGSSITDAFLEWLDASPRRQPFFSFLNFFDAHHPYVPVGPHAAAFGVDIDLEDVFTLLSRDPGDVSPRSVTSAIAAYDAATAGLDAEIGRLISALRTRGFLNDTVLVITSDHGEEFGEHGVFEHGNTLYRQSLEVPLVVRFPPAVPQGIRIAGPVSLVDVPVTMLELAGIRDHGLPGRSLSEWWRSNRSGIQDPVISELGEGVNVPASLPSSRGDMVSVVANGRHYIANGDGVIEAYAFDSDPSERNNLGPAAAGQEVRRLLDRLRRAMSARATWPRAVRAGHVASR
jgi:arylsulfatase A-like enzyme